MNKGKCFDCPHCHLISARKIAGEWCAALRLRPGEYRATASSHRIGPDQPSMLVQLVASGMHLKVVLMSILLAFAVQHLQAQQTPKPSRLGCTGRRSTAAWCSSTSTAGITVTAAAAAAAAAATAAVTAATAARADRG